MMVPAPLILLGLGGMSVAGKGTGVKLGAGAVAAAGIVGLGTQVYGPGDPAPQTVRSPAVPTGLLAAGQPLPAGTAIVRTTLQLEAGAVRRRELTLACPPGLRVADLLTPGARGWPSATRLARRWAPTASRGSHLRTPRCAAALA